MAFVYTGEQVDLAFGRGWLNGPAAASIRRIDRQIGHPLQITEAGRTWAQQNVHYQRYLRYGSPIALSPNAPSLHQKGNAVDSNEAQRVHAVMEDHGWRRTVYRYVNGKWTLVEPWHYEYFPQYDNHRHEGTASAGAGIEDDMPTMNEFLNTRAYDGGPTISEVLKALDRNLAPAVVDLVWARKVDRGVDANGNRVLIDAIQELADGKTLDMQILAIVQQLAGRTGADVDEGALAAALAPLLTSNLGALSDADVARVATAAADEQDRRNRERLNG